MKYVHNGKVYVIFSAFDGVSHSEVASVIGNIQHAGSIHFSDKETKKADSYGKSDSLKIESQPFDYDEINYVGLSHNNLPVISNSKEILEKLNVESIKEAVWKLSKEGHYGECPVMYPGHPSDHNTRACRLLKS